MVAEDIRDLQSGRATSAALTRLPGAVTFLGRWRRQARERALDGGDPTCGDTCVARRRVQLGMPKQSLDQPDIGAALEQMRGKAVAQRMQATRFLMPAASAVSWNRRLSWRVVRCSPCRRPGNSQRSCGGTPAS